MAAPLKDRLGPAAIADIATAFAWLQAWAVDEDPHVRRLVSEGTRPRLPWASRLDVFAPDFAPVVELLDTLKDDPSLYVRRSVANHVGDLAKIDVGLAVRVTRPWTRVPRAEVAWVVKHALRHPLKKGHPEVLALFGFGGDPALALRAEVTPARVERGGSATVEVTVTNPHADVRSAVIDLVVHFVKARGKTSPKVFKLRSVELAPGERQSLRKTISLADLSTRRHHPGTHRVGVQVNGVEHPAGTFELR